ncbi:hypothetical protein [Streptomyces sp. NPDC059786]|uniref:hypothetical protein n=1 Tax=Streptomyces sp. NPDC059786 TaxID=3346946 RepID=UPI003657CCEF
MTITDLIPSLKGRGRRRAVDEVERLRENEIVLLRDLHAAGDEIALLGQALAEARACQGEAELVVVCQQADIDDLTAERNALQSEVGFLRRKFAAELADEANAAAVDVPPMTRIGTDQDTGAVDVTTLWDAADAGLLPGSGPGRLSNPLGAVTDPGQVPELSTADTLPIPTVKEVA